MSGVETGNHDRGPEEFYNAHRLDQTLVGWQVRLKRENVAARAAQAELIPPHPRYTRETMEALAALTGTAAEIDEGGPDENGGTNGK